MGWQCTRSQADSVERLLMDPDPGMFAVVASSNSGLSADVLTDLVSRHFAVRRTLPPDAPALPPSKLQERASTVSRLAASLLYRSRRRIREEMSKRR
jgi:hypothetical protein